MEIWSLVFAGISAAAAVVSAITSIIAKKELKQLKNNLNNSPMTLSSEDNKGNLVGINNGEINR